MPQPPSFDDKESDYEDLRDEMPYSCAIYQRSYGVGTFNFQSLKEFLNIWRLYKYPCLPCNIIRENFQIPIKEGPLP